MGRPKVGRPRTVNMFWVIVFHHPGAVYEYSIISPRIMKDDDVWNIVQSRKGTPVKVETYCFDNIDDANEVYESLMEEHGRTPLKLKVVDGQVVAEDDEDKKKGKGNSRGKGNAPRKNGKATLKAKKAKGGHMKKSRDNATFTLDQSYGSGDGDRTLVQEFYNNLKKRFPGKKTPVKIPTEGSVHPAYDIKAQLYILADYVTRKIAPIALSAAGFRERASILKELAKITDELSAFDAYAGMNVFNLDRITSSTDEDNLGIDVLSAVKALLVSLDALPDINHQNLRGLVDSAAFYSSIVVHRAAKLNPDATWEAVNEMLREICGESPRNKGKLTLAEKKARYDSVKKSRDNATFTLDQTYGSGDGDRTLIETFYDVLDKAFPGNRSIPIPLESQVHPKHDTQRQAFIFADYAVRRIAPIALRAAGLTEEAVALKELKPIIDIESANSVVYSACDHAAYRAREYADIYYEEDDSVFVDIAKHAEVAALAARAAARACAADAAHGPAAYAAVTAFHTNNTVYNDVTWKVVNEMLREICGESPRNNGKVTLKSKSKTKSKVTIKTHDDDHDDHHHDHYLDEYAMEHGRDNGQFDDKSSSSLVDNLFSQHRMMWSGRDSVGSIIARNERKIKSIKSLSYGEVNKEAVQFVVSSICPIAIENLLDPLSGAALYASNLRRAKNISMDGTRRDTESSYSVLLDIIYNITDNQIQLGLIHDYDSNHSKLLTILNFACRAISELVGDEQTGMVRQYPNIYPQLVLEATCDISRDADEHCGAELQKFIDKLSAQAAKKSARQNRSRI